MYDAWLGCKAESWMRMTAVKNTSQCRWFQERRKRRCRSVGLEIWLSTWAEWWSQEDGGRGSSSSISEGAAAAAARSFLSQRVREPAPPLATTRQPHVSTTTPPVVADQLFMHTLSRCPRQLRIHDGRKHLPPSWSREKDSCPPHIKIPNPSARAIGAYPEGLLVRTTASTPQDLCAIE